ncbi:MAG TPA: hypothetical protein EYP59_00760 [Thiotrichaceae bacterium]|nr:hypothetical protein [Thiotrichaceae bacterium]
MTAEEIYPTIDENNSDEAMDRFVYENEASGQSDGQGSDLNEQPNESGDKLGQSCNEQGDNIKAPSQGRWRRKRLMV